MENWNIHPKIRRFVNYFLGLLSHKDLKNLNMVTVMLATQSWWQFYELLTEFLPKWHLLNVGVTVILKLSPTLFVSNMRHQHRCKRFGFWPILARKNFVEIVRIVHDFCPARYLAWIFVLISNPGLNFRYFGFCHNLWLIKTPSLQTR